MTRLRAASVAFAIFPIFAPLVRGQDAPPPLADQQQQQQAPPVQNLAPQQLDSLVAPIALYPDSLLSQVMVASTYPLEIVEADRWLQQNGNLQGTALIQAAQQQNWDPSIQSLVAFPDVIKRLDSDIRWTTDLGNAFLSQQAAVMDAVQRMRASAQASGKLTDTPQQRIVTENQGGQSAIEIEPTDPQVVYAPVYNPAYFWGAPSPYYPWPGLYYPGVGVGWGWGFGINIGGFYGGCCGWGGWGWGPGWFNHSIYVNNSFFHRYGYRDFHGDGAFRGNSAWAHDSSHRLGIPYPNRAVASRFGGGTPGNNFRGAAGANRGAVGESRGNAGQSFQRQEGNAGVRQAAPAQRNFEQGTNNHSAFGGTENGSRSRVQSDHGFSSMGPQRTAPAFHGGGGGGGGAAPHSSGGGAHGGGRR